MVFGVPSSAFSAAAAATGKSQHAGYLLAIWIGASAASIAAVVCAAVLMVHSRSRQQEDDDEPLPSVTLSKASIVPENNNHE